jgi:hypothetical protein
LKPGRSKAWWRRIARLGAGDRVAAKQDPFSMFRVMCDQHVREAAENLAFQGFLTLPPQERLLAAFRQGTPLCAEELSAALWPRIEDLVPSDAGDACPICACLDACDCGDRRTCSATGWLAQTAQHLTHERHPYQLCRGHMRRIRDALTERGLSSLINSVEVDGGMVPKRAFCPLFFVVNNIGGAVYATLGSRTMQYGCPACRAARECTCGEGEACPMRHTAEIAADLALRHAADMGLLTAH